MTPNGELSLHLQDGALAVPGRRGRRRRPAGRRRVRRLPRRGWAARRSRGRGVAKASPASSPSTRRRCRSINAAFTPSADDIAHAEAIVAAFEAQPDAGVLSVGGKMVDRPHLVQARRVLDRSR